MSRFNETIRREPVHNLAGGRAYKESAELELASILLTSFVQDKFYRNAKDELNKLNDLVSQVDPMFAAKAAVYARNEMGMRSITHVLAALIARYVKGHRWTKNFYRAVVRRPDDMTEILSLYLQWKLPIPNSLKKGFGLAFEKFDAYQLGKYRNEGKKVSLVDVVNLVHPKPVDKNREALRQLVKGTLRQTGTWENEISATGGAENKEQAKEEAWERLLNEGKLGYMALLKNLRNIANQAPHMIPVACEQLVNREAIHKSLVMPFRFDTAFEEVNNQREYVIALSKALEISLDNVPKFAGKTLVVVDESGSMGGKPAKIASLFAAVLLKTNDADLLKFATRARYSSANPMDSAMTIAKKMGFSGGGTNFHSIFQTANKPYDRIIILSDMQGWVGYNSPAKTFKEYKQRYNCDPFVYSWDLLGYGTLQFPERNVFALAGFNSEVFELMKNLEEGGDTLVAKIKSVEF